MGTSEFSAQRHEEFLPGSYTLFFLSSLCKCTMRFAPLVLNWKNGLCYALGRVCSLQFEAISGKRVMVE